MCVPLFAPSPDLLLAWHAKYKLLKERTWFGVHGKPRRASPLPRFGNASLARDPNDDFDAAAMRPWVLLADFYQWPHITTFDSVAALGPLLANADLAATSAAMARHNENVRARIRAQWAGALDAAFPRGTVPRREAADPPAAPSFDAAMATFYNVTVDKGCVGDRRAVAPVAPASAAPRPAAPVPRGNASKRVISYGLYGKNPKYVRGAVRNAELVGSVFPGWVCRFYVDGSVPPPIVAELETLGAEVVPISHIQGKIAGMFWRFLVADDPRVAVWLVRDADSRLNAREKAAVDEWLGTDFGVHTMRDHPNHRRPLNAGMFGGRRGALGRPVAGLVAAWKDKGAYGGDLRFLNRVIWPLVKHDQLGHDAYYCAEFANARSFPTKRPDNFQHVGQVFDARDNPRMDDIDRFMRNKPAPRKCRRKPGFTFG